MRPRSLPDLWQWALDESFGSKATPPERLHTRAFPPGTDPDEAKNTDEHKRTHDVKGRRLSKRRDQIIGGPPYTRRFERYLESALPRAPIHRAMDKMRSPGKRSVQSMEYRVVWAIVEGRYPDAGMLSWTLRAREDFVRAAAVRGLGLLWDLVQIEIAGEADSVRKIERAHSGGIHA